MYHSGGRLVKEHEVQVRPTPYRHDDLVVVELINVARQLRIDAEPHTHECKQLIMVHVIMAWVGTKGKEQTCRQARSIIRAVSMGAGGCIFIEYRVASRWEVIMLA